MILPGNVAKCIGAPAGAPTFVSFILVKTSKDYINFFHSATINKRVDVSFC